MGFRGGGCYQATISAKIFVDDTPVDLIAVKSVAVVHCAKYTYPGSNISGSITCPSAAPSIAIACISIATQA